MIKTVDLFDISDSHLSEIFERAEYPWQILPLIKDYIRNCLKCGLSGYELLSEIILVGENVVFENNVTISGPCIIGANTVVRAGAYIRGDSIIGKNCVVGNSTELKNCILMNNVQVPHYNYVGDSILGNNVHLGAGVICSNLKNNKNNVYVGKEKIDTTLRKVGSFIGDNADIGCNCVLNPGTVIGKNTICYPLQSLRGIFPPSVIIKSYDNVVERRM